MVKEKVRLAIVTPTYNREMNLKALYQSLCSQTVQKFKWIIIDDGSTDNTRNLIEKFISEKKINMEYFYKENGGKHRAINYVISKVNEEYTFIVDSDDYLTADAVELIIENLKDNDSISFLRGDSRGLVIGDEFPKTNYIDTFYNVRINQKITGDKAEIWKTKLILENPFLEFENEKFFSEAYVWISISFKTSMLFINKIIYICEYLDGGLTKSGRRMRLSNPNSGIENSKILINKRFKFKIRFKYTILFIVYCLFARKRLNEIIKCAPNKTLALVLYLPSMVLFWVLRYKYRER